MCRSRGGVSRGRAVRRKTRRSTWASARTSRRAIRKTKNGAQKVKGSEGEERSDEEGKIKGLLVLEVKWLIPQVLSV